MAASGSDNDVDKIHTVQIHTTPDSKDPNFTDDESSLASVEDQVNLPNYFLRRIEGIIGRDPRAAGDEKNKDDIILTSPFLKFCTRVDLVPVAEDAAHWKKIYSEKRQLAKALAKDATVKLSSAEKSEINRTAAAFVEVTDELIRASVIYSYALELKNRGAAKRVEVALAKLLTQLVGVAEALSQSLKRFDISDDDDSDLSDEEVDISTLLEEAKTKFEVSFAEKQKEAKAAKEAARNASTPRAIVSSDNSSEQRNKQQLENRTKNRRSTFVSGNLRFQSPNEVHTIDQAAEEEANSAELRQLCYAQGQELTRIANMVENMVELQSRTQQESSNGGKTNVTVLNNPSLFFKTANHMSDEFLSTLPGEFAQRPTVEGSRFVMPEKNKTTLALLTGEADYDLWKASYIKTVYQYDIDISTKVLCLRESVDTKNPDIKRIVGNVKPDAYGFRSIVQALHSRYGNKEAYQRKLYSNLMAHQPISMSNSEALFNFKSDLWDFIQNEYREGRSSEVENESNHLYSSVANKLNYSARENLIMYCRLQHKPYSLLSLMQWTVEMVESLEKSAALFSRNSAAKESTPAQRKVVKQTTCEPLTSDSKPISSDCGVTLYTTASNYEYLPEKVFDSFDDRDELTEEFVEKVNITKGTPIECPLCRRLHKLKNCQEFIKMNPLKRRELMLSLCYCYNCIEKGHITVSCEEKSRCEICNGKHHSLLHVDKPRDSQRPANSKKLGFKNGAIPKTNLGKNIAKTNLCDTEDAIEVAADDDSSLEACAFHARGDEKVKIGLRTFPVIVENPVTRKKMRINAMLDDGSTTTLLDDSVAKTLGLKFHPAASPITICGIGGIEAGSSDMQANFILRSTRGNHKSAMTANVFKDPCQKLLPSFWLNHETLKDLDFDEPEPDKVRLLIGCNYSEFHVSLEDRAATSTEPAARKTVLGWTAIGHMAPADIQKQDALRQSTEKDASMDSNKSFIRENTLLVSCIRKQYFPDQAADLRLEDILRQQSDLYRLDDDFDEVVPKLTDEEQFALDTLNESVKLVDAGNGKKQYQISTLWKSSEPNFLSNHNYAEKRLMSTVKNKLSDPECFKKYDEKIKGWLESNYIEETENEPDKPQFFLPHFPVIRQDKTTTKIRPVMDAAARCKGPDGPKCLNDGLLEGPKLIKSVPEVLLRFRHNRIAVIGDLKEMFLQVILPERDRDFHKFIWFDENRNKKFYRFKVHCFGNRSSPAVAIFAIKHHAELHKDQYPRAVETILESTIVDDNCDSVETREDALKLISDLRTLYSTAGMEIRKWASNDKEIMANMSDEDKATNVVFSYDFEPDSNMPKIKALGIIWIAEPDILTFLAEFDLNQIWTKRTVLSAYSKLFDPIGLIAPVAITARIVTQACWRHGLGWDETLPEKILKRWKIWVDSLSDLPKLKINRGHKPTIGQIESEEVHIFCDGSLHAYGAVAYNVCKLADKTVYSNIIMSKARVAPLKGETSNKLELRGAVCAATVAKVIKRVLKVPHQKIYFWTDSKNVLAWLNTKKWLVKFVQNRVTQIKYVSDREQWRWLPTQLNPADELSRGSTVTQLLHNDRWWVGPEFIRQYDRHDWPVQPKRYDTHVLDVINEKVIGVPFDGTATKGKNEEPSTSLLIQNPAPCKSEKRDIKKSSSDNRIDSHSDEDDDIIKRFSSWKRFVKVCCWILRWKSQPRTDITKIKPKADSKSKVSKPLPYTLFIKYTPSLNLSVNHVGAVEYEAVETKLIALYQGKHFAETFDQLKKNPKKIVSVKNHIYKLNPQVDSDGLLRVNGRLRDIGQLGRAARPILLPKDEHITKIIILHYHIDVCCHYGGTHYLHSRVLERFWPVNGHRQCQRIVTRCSRCQILKKKAQKQQMATLPEFRIPSIHQSTADMKQALLPYTHTGLDYGGPLVTKQGRAKARQKRWFCLFTCLQCRAIHIEMVWSLSTDSFLQAFERFIARNCKPKHLYMDNQTTFVKAEKDIKEWMDQNAVDLKNRATQKFSTIEFHFIPPASPNYGGAWESMIKQAKRCIYDKIRDGIVTDEELLTVFATVESLINARPLMKASSDPEDLQILTPAHFLIRGTYESLAPIPNSWHEKQRYLFIQDLISSMWERLLKEVIPKKNKFEKNVRETEQVEVGDLVIMLNDRDRDRSWPVGVVTKTLTSHDDIIRRCEIKFNDKTFIRSSKDFVKLQSINW